MNSLTNQEKARIFAMYIGCPMVEVDNFDNIPFIGVSNEQGDYWIISDSDTIIRISDQLHVNLLLRPLSAITDEDAIEVAKIVWPGIVYKDNSNGITLESLGRDFIANQNGKVNNQNILFAFRYLISKGYDVPQFIAPNHPENNKTAIEMGIAIDIKTVK